MEKEYGNIRKSVEKELNYEFRDEEALNVLRYASRKCRLKGKDDSYLQILYEDELINYVLRKEVTDIGRWFLCA